MKTVLVVEDEPIALEDLRDSLHDIDPALEIIGVQTAMEALDLIGSRKSGHPKKIDGIFLDIELPGMSGIQMLERLGKDAPPVVLVTAHAMMALDAFGFGVISCLLKPVDQQHLRQAYNQIKEIADAPVRHSPTGDSYVRGPQSRVFLRDRNGGHMVQVREITHLIEEDGATRIFFGDTSGLVPHTLTEMETGLDRNHFFRVNASVIINLNKVTRFNVTADGFFAAVLPDGTTAEFSPERSRLFQSRYEI